MLIASALRTNNNLELLDIEDNEITIAGHEALREALFDYSAFDIAVSDSNQTCRIEGLNSSSSCTRRIRGRICTLSSTMATTRVSTHKY